VFQALTDPSQTRQWWGQKGMYSITESKVDLRPGGKWSSAGVGAGGKSFRVDGEYLEVDPPRLLVHTWNASWAGDLKTVVRWELEPRDVHGLQHTGPRKMDTGTLVRLRHEGFAGNLEQAKNTPRAGLAFWAGCRRLSRGARRWRAGPRAISRYPRLSRLLRRLGSLQHTDVPLIRKSRE
jgi:uncharacterized protein YndB with AHSA1/START domain